MSEPEPQPERAKTGWRLPSPWRVPARLLSWIIAAILWTLQYPLGRRINEKVYGATNRIDFAGIAHAVGAQGLSGDALLVLGLAMIIAGLGFKSSSAPFHMWTPDVYEGAPTTVTAFMSAATKVAAFALAFRLLRTAFPAEEHLWSWAFAGIAVASLAIGNLAALVQRNVKRMLAYSSISHARFLLLGLPAGTALAARAL